MKIIEKIWFDNKFNENIGICIFGIILCEDEITKEKQAYFGVGKGMNADESAKEIIDFGAKLPASTAKHILDFLKPNAGSDLENK